MSARANANPPPLPMEIAVEAPDLVVMRMSGSLEPDAVHACMKEIRRLTEGWPYVLQMVFLDGSGGMSPEARKVAAEVADGIPYAGSAMVGGSFALRVVGKMLVQVISLTRKLDNPTRFFKSEAEAREWLAERRHALAAARRNA